MAASLAYNYAREGRKQEALKLLEELKETARDRYVSGVLFAQVYVGLGENDQALRWLERAYEDRDTWTQWTNIWPLLDPLRSEPRFIALLKKVGLDK